jgi:hypothetical protein
MKAMVQNGCFVVDDDDDDEIQKNIFIMLTACLTM